MTLSQKRFLYMLPILLLLSTAWVFVSFAGWFSKPAGYVAGFLFYDGFWCLGVPYFLLGKRNFLALFKEDRPLFQKKYAWLALLLLSTTAGALGMAMSHDLAQTPVALIAIAIPAAILTATCEEILWRGLYVKAFPRQVFAGLLLPTLGYAVWHLSPQLIYPASMPGGMFAFAGLTFFLGLCYGLVSYKTGSCKWTAISHSLNGVLDLGGALAPAIYALLFTAGLQ